jgi:hypothetical protein
MSERGGFIAWSGVLATWTGIASALVGGYFALQAYKADISGRADARVVQTFALFQAFNSGEVLASRKRVMAAFSGDQVQPTGFEILGDQKGKFPPGVVINDQDLFVFVDFFDAVDICVSRNLCDSGLVRDLFRPYAAGNLQRLKPWIDRVRNEETNIALDRPFGAGMEWIATGQRPTTLPAASNR